MQRFILCVAALIVLVGIGQTNAAVTTYNARQDFSGTSNPNGQWSYGWSYSLGGSMNVYPDYTIDYRGFYGWRDDSLYPSDDIPHVTQADDVFGWPVGPDELIFHPGWNEEYSIIRWTAPADGTADVTAEFAGAHFGTTAVFVHRNTDMLFDAVLPGYAVAPPYNSALSVQAGDTIDFAVGMLGNAAGTTTAVSAIIDFSPVPEPSTILIWSLLGIIGIAYGWRRRR